MYEQSDASHPKCLNKVLVFCTQNFWTKVFLYTQNVWTKVMIRTPNVCSSPCFAYQMFEQKSKSYIATTNFDQKCCVTSLPKCLNKRLVLHPKCLKKILALHSNVWPKVLLCTQNVWTKVLLCTPNVWTRALFCTPDVWSTVLLCITIV